MAKKTRSHESCEHGECAQTTPVRKTLKVEPELKAKNLARLKRIEGQVRGIQKMIEEDRYCADVLTQISAVHEALRGVGRELLRHHLRHCMTQTIKAGGEQAESVYDEVIDLMYKNTR
jgi:DNA-binding FrmR family transcriptional regulator